MVSFGIFALTSPTDNPVFTDFQKFSYSLTVLSFPVSVSSTYIPCVTSMTEKKRERGGEYKKNQKGDQLGPILRIAPEYLRINVF